MEELPLSVLHSFPQITRALFALGGIVCVLGLALPQSSSALETRLESAWYGLCERNDVRSEEQIRQVLGEVYGAHDPVHVIHIQEYDDLKYVTYKKGDSVYQSTKPVRIVRYERIAELASGRRIRGGCCNEILSSSGYHYFQEEEGKAPTHGYALGEPLPSSREYMAQGHGSRENSRPGDPHRRGSSLPSPQPSNPHDHPDRDLGPRHDHMTPVPELETWILFLAGLIGLRVFHVVIRRRRKK